MNIFKKKSWKIETENPPFCKFEPEEFELNRFEPEEFELEKFELEELFKLYNFEPTKESS